MSKSHEILLAHDKPNRREQYATLLTEAGYHVDTADCGEAAADMFAHKEYAVVILDVLMPETLKDAAEGHIDQPGGLYALQRINDIRSYVPVILFSRHEPDTLIREQFRAQGIFDYLVRDEDNFSFKFLNRVANAVEVYDSRLARLAASPNVVWKSSEMLDVLMKARKLAESDIPVLLLGETGTGKSLLASEVHRCSLRNEAPFLELNCASMPENLVESQLFGHVKGAFTGAVADKRGYFQRAHKGTLFLDEIGEMTQATQAKLLDILETSRLTPVGGETEYEVDVRIICATNRDLDQMVSEGKFREDLYYRVRYEKILLPPLRERKDDIPVLIDFFVQQFRDKYNRQIVVRPAFYDRLAQYPLNGNVRELKSMVKAALYRLERQETELTRYHLEPYRDTKSAKAAAGAFFPTEEAIRAKLADGKATLDDLVDEFKFKIIDAAMAETEGVAEQAAKKLGVNAHTLRRHLRHRENGGE